MRWVWSLASLKAEHRAVGVWDLGSDEAGAAEVSSLADLSPSVAPLELSEDPVRGLPQEHSCNESLSRQAAGGLLLVK